jgi:glutamine amidotransferase
VVAVDDRFYPSIEGTTDSETMFYLALTFGLEEDPIGAVARMVGFVEQAGHRRDIEHPVQMTIAATDGTTIWAFRYSSEGASRSLWFSTRMDALKALYPDSPELASLSDETRAVVSEPLGDLPGAWNEAPESHVGIVQPGIDELRPFAPAAPA